MSIWWLASAAALILGYTFAEVRGAALVERWTGRSIPDRRSFLTNASYELTHVGIALGIALPPIYLLPDADSLVYVSFWMTGIVVGALTAQALFGRRVEKQ